MPQKTGCQFGGTDDEGTVEISPSEMTIYKKSKAVGLAFGAIGSAIAGKGKPLHRSVRRISHHMKRI